MSDFKNIEQVSVGQMAGLSLIELMIAMLLGIILTLGATQIFIGSSQTARLTDAVANVQETARFSKEIMDRQIRSAGGLGCLAETADVTVLLNALPQVQLDDGIMGWEGNNTGLGSVFTPVTTRGGGGWTEGEANAPLPAALAGQVVDRTDVLVVNSTRTAPVTVAAANAIGAGVLALTGPSTITAGRLVLAMDEDCEVGELFQNSNANLASVSIAPAGVPGNIGGASFSQIYSPPGARIAEFSSVAYYVGMDLVTNEPTLFSQRLGEGPQPALPLITGVESMQVLYGVAAGGGEVATQYVAADAVADWTNVVSVRVALLSRSNDRVLDREAVREFNLVGATVQSPLDRRLRLLATTTIGLRNRLE